MVSGKWLIVLLGTVLLTTPLRAAEKIAVVFEEQVRGVMGISGTWMTPGTGEEVVLRKLRAAGYEVVDSQTLRANILREQAMQVLGGDEKAAIALGQQFEAPLVLIGKGFAKPSGNVLGTSMRSHSANVQLRVIQSETAMQVATATGSAQKPHVDEVTGGGLAIAAAAETAVDELIDALQKAKANTAWKPSALKVNISGLKSYRHYLYLKDWIEAEVEGVGTLKEPKYQTGTAQFELPGSIEGPALAEQIARAQFNGFVVNPVEVTKQKVSLKVLILEQK